MKSLQGSIGQCPYLAGQNKWDVTYKGVDMMTGNFGLTVTDLSFEGGFGIPVNVTRSYSSNQYDDGPFGQGWTLSADMRSTAGGVIKSSHASTSTIPVTIEQRPTLERDPNSVVGNGQAAQPVAAVTSTDAGGHQETIQRDVDGVLTTPPWDNSVHNAIYAFQAPAWANGAVYQLIVSDTVTTMDGTTYTYQTEGSYVNGQLPYNAQFMNPPPAPTPANVLKVTSAADKQGNTTFYTYSANPNLAVAFHKSDGITVENPLVSVQMPNGHTLTLNWGSGPTASRVTSITDNAGRTVNYGYGNGLLTSVTTPAGLTTTYNYGSPTYYQGPNGYGGYGWYTDPSVWSYDIASNLLTSIQDPRGVITPIVYAMQLVWLAPYNVYLPAPVVAGISLPGQTQTVFGFSTFPVCPSGYADEFTGTGLPSYAGGNYQYQSAYSVKTVTNNSAGQMQVFAGSMGGPQQSFYAPGNTWYGNVVTFEANTDWSKYYNLGTFDLVNEAHFIRPVENFEWTAPGSINNQALCTQAPYFPLPNWQGQGTFTSTVYNFAGQPLSLTVTEKQGNFDGSISTVATHQTDYAYWDQSKYWQQKAVRTLNGDGSYRYSYFDYYPNTAAAGSRGQLFQVYDPAHGGIWIDPNHQPPPPPWASTSDYWKYDITPGVGQYTVQCAYDSVGRLTDVYKLQSTTTNPWKYAHSQTSYGTNTDGSWGGATQAVEDVGGINRTTITKYYTPDGKASDVISPDGHEYLRSFDPDGRLLSITQIDVTPNVAIATYHYGTTGQMSTGMPSQMIDGLSGAQDTIYYVNSGPGIGQVAQVSETFNGSTSSSSYSYNALGSRANVLYQTPTGSTSWAYGDYVPVGPVDRTQWAFTTLTELDPSGNPTPEVIHYLFDTAGRVEGAAFAQSPAAGFTPSAGSPWYDSNHLASLRCRAYYSYDPAGRTLGLAHVWDSMTSGAYTTTAVQANTCTYETSGAARGLKLTSTFYGPNPSTPLWQEAYGYDNALDYLVSANYGDGQPNASQTWSYDAAGNRASDYTGSNWTYDNLNRMTASPNVSYENDILGDRVEAAVSGSIPLLYTWDSQRRLVSTHPMSLVYPGPSTAYAYRADNLRVQKVDHTGVFQGNVEVGNTITSYFYDGQMPFESFTLNPDGSTTEVDQAVGPRGLECTSTTSGQQNGGLRTFVSFPLFDAHGNQVAALSRTGNGFTVSNQRSYGAWGEVRQGASTGAPNSRYCASLGHLQDDETGLVYMRSRYYDPVSGRFISEDPSCQGLDWFMYAGNRPTCAKDYSGNGLTLDDIKEIKEIAVSIVALLHFEDKLKECKSSLEVEEEYEKFLEKWKETVPSDDDVADAFKDLIKDANGESSSFGDVLDELKDGVLDGAKLVILSLAYTARLDWYIKDIDRDD